MRCIGAHSHLWLDACGLLLVLESLILSLLLYHFSNIGCKYLLVMLQFYYQVSLMKILNVSSLKHNQDSGGVFHFKFDEACCKDLDSLGGHNCTLVWSLADICHPT